MIVITGGAGMIGSIIAWHLNTKLQRDDMVIVDRITHENQWQNLVKRQYVQYLDKDQLMPWLRRTALTLKPLFTWVQSVRLPSAISISS